MVGVEWGEVGWGGLNVGARFLLPIPALVPRGTIFLPCHMPWDATRGRAHAGAGCLGTLVWHDSRPRTCPCLRVEMYCQPAAERMPPF